jgi:hypothetical protein
MISDFTNTGLVMMIPLKLVSRLVMSTWEKVFIGGAFSVGVISMIFAIVRVVALVSKTGAQQASPTWLALWAVIEDLVGKRRILLKFLLF